MASRRVARIGFLVAFAVLTLPILTFLGLSLRSLTVLWIVDTSIRSIPLCLAIVLDGVFMDGGELSPELIPVWTALTGLLLWPLLALGIRPALWRMRAWRNGILGYAGVAVACSVAAGTWIFTHTGYLF